MDILAALLAFSSYRPIELLKAFEIKRKAPEPAANYARWDSITYDGIM